MSDIHVLDGRKVRNGVWVYNVVFHVPIDTPKATVKFPDFTSAVPDIQAAELTSIQNGTISDILSRPSCNSGYVGSASGACL